MSIFQAALSLFFVLNALGNVPLFISILAKFNQRRQRTIILRELLIALGIMLGFNYFGDDFLNLLGITQPMIGIAGGTVLFLISLGMIFPRPKKETASTQEPLVVPLAMPLVAGPGVITSVMLYAQQMNDPMGMTIAIILAWLPTLLILFAASNLRRLLGEKGLIACERLSGMLICLIAVKLFTLGLFDLIKAYF